MMKIFSIILMNKSKKLKFYDSLNMYVYDSLYMTEFEKIFDVEFFDSI